MTELKCVSRYKIEIKSGDAKRTFYFRTSDERRGLRSPASHTTSSSIGRRNGEPVTEYIIKTAR